MKVHYSSFNVHPEIHDRLKKFGLEIYDWALCIFAGMFSIIIFKRFIVIAFVTDVLIFLFLRNYKKGKPDYYTGSVLSFLFTPRELYILEPENDDAEAGPCF